MKLTSIGNSVHKWFLWVLTIIVLLVTSGLDHNLNRVWAQQFPGPISMSMGGAGAAGFWAPESALVNPAAISLTTPMDVGLMYQDGSVQRGVHKTGLGLLISDNSEDVLFPGAIYYAKGSRKFHNQGAQEQLWSVILGKFYWEKKLSLGLRLTYLTSEVAGDRQYKQLTPGFGAILQMTETFSLGLALENLTGSDKKVPQAFRLNPETRIGVRYKPMELFSLLLDISRQEADNPDKEGVIHLGLESHTNAFTLLRLGGQWDNRIKQNFFTFGAGFDGPRLKVNYSLQKALKGTDGALHGVDFRVSF